MEERRSEEEEGRREEIKIDGWRRNEEGWGGRREE